MFDAAQLDQLFPFRLEVDAELRVSAVGPVLARLLPNVTEGSLLRDHFRLLRPRLELNAANLVARPRSLYVLQADTVALKGQVFHDLKSGTLHYLATPWVREFAELGALGLSVSDYAVHDGTVDYLLALQLRSTSVDELTDLAEDLKRTQQQLLQAGKLAALGQLAGEVAHELNNPLLAVVMNAELLREDIRGYPELSGSRDRLDNLQRACAECKTTVEKLLGFARRSPGRQVETDLGNVARAAVALLEGRLRAKAVNLEVDIPNSLPVLGDDTELQQVVVNLLLNASQVIADGGSVRLAAEVSDRVVKLSVSDDGGGIDDADLPYIFEPFFTTKPAGAGTGLGLVLSARIINEHGGSIDVEPNVGEGARFTLVLPAVVGSATAARLQAAAAESTALGAEASAQVGTVLLIDDETEFVLLPLAHTLRRAGYTVHATDDPEAALALAGEQEIHVVLIDQIMPAMRGLDLMAKLQRVSPRTLYVLMSGNLTPEDIARADQLDAFDCLAKPCSRAELIAVVRRARAAWLTRPS